ncbi:MAG: ABC transporter ATP-binding protein [Bacteroidales bacterium]|nr:ABC transporter ATP-binding protein [Bacteroidales bacterium]
MKNWIHIFRYLKDYKRWIALHVFCIIFSVIGSICSFVMIAPFLKLLFGVEDINVVEPGAFELNATYLSNYLNYFLNNIIVHYGSYSALGFVVGLVIFSSLIRTLFSFLASSCLVPIRGGISRSFRNKMYEKVTKLPLSYFSKEKKGDLMSRMTNDVQEVEWSILSSLESFICSPIEIIGFLLMLFFLNYQLTLFVLLLLPIAALIIGSLGVKLKKSSTDAQSKMGLMLSTIEETLSGIRIIKAFTAEKIVNQKFQKKNQEYTKIQMRIFRRNYLASPLSEFLSWVIVGVILAFGGYLVLNSNSSFPAEAFITYIMFFTQIISPAKKFTTANYNLQKGVASLNRIEEVLNAKNTILEKENAIKISSFAHQIEYKNVYFKYLEDWILHNINLTIKHGQTIALVGQSGSGKSTMADMLPRFYDVNEGEILIDGKDIKDLNINNLRNLFGIVNQEPILFNDTIFNNIAFGMEHVEEESVYQAATIANAHEFIVQCPDGYHTNIGDRGNNLSGGQRTRISIARALLHNPPILILDEATSSLDSESEKLVQEALDHLMKTRTSIVIAHRLSTIYNADLICVLQKGKIVEQGTHHDLLQIEHGIYRKLYETQAFQE